MKKLILIVAIATLTGCASYSYKDLAVQKMLNAALPPSFEGDFHLDHANPYFQVPALDFKNLKKKGGIWTWTSMSYNGHSLFTATNVVIKPDSRIKLTPALTNNETK